MTLASGDLLKGIELKELVTSRDLIELGALADERRRQKHGTRVTFVRVQDVITQVSTGGIEVLPAAGELRILIEPETREEATALTEHVVAAAGSVPVTGFSLDALAALCDSDAASLKGLLTDLQRAGLAMVSEVRADTPRAREWLEVTSDAGVDVARLTIGELGSMDGVELLRQVGGWGEFVTQVHAFAPLPRVVDGRVTTGYGDMRQVALARLLIDNIDSIQVDWSQYGPKLAQVALTFGADDVDAVSAVDSLGQGHRRAPLEEIKRNIQAAGQIPVQRNGHFETLKV